MARSSTEHHGRVSPERRLSESQLALLVEYLDGELPPEERAAVAAWLERDEAARYEFELLRRVDEYVDYLPRARARPGLTERTRSLLAQSTPFSIRAPSWWLRRLTVLAALLLFGAGCALFGAALRQATAPHTEQTILRNLELLQYLPLLRELGSRERLDVILESGMFEEASRSERSDGSRGESDEVAHGPLPGSDR